MRGRKVRRVLATAALALYWGLMALWSQFSFDPPGPLHDLWYSMAPILIGSVLFWELVFPLSLGVLVRQKGLAPATRTA